MPFIDLATQYELNRDAINKAIQKVLDHGQYIMGPEVKELESRLADFSGAQHVLACSSGTDALVIPLMTKRLSAEDAVFTSPFTFFASAEAISLAGGTPVFVDIDPDTYNMDPNCLRSTIEKVLREGKLKPKGIVPVDLFGIAANFEQIKKIASEFDLFILEDAAQSFGAEYHGLKAGAIAEMGATSFYPAKPLGGYGDGGAIFCNDQSLYEEMVSIRVHGQGKSGDKYDNIRIGLNGRLDTIQAAVLLEKLKLYPQEVARRQQVADQYTHLLKGVVKTPIIPTGQSSVWAQYSIQVEDRQKVRDHLAQNEVPTAVFYPVPIHLSSAYKHLGYKKGDFPVSEKTAMHIMSLPMHPFLTQDQIKRTADLIIESN